MSFSIDAMGWALIHSVWQGGLLAGILCLALSLVSTSRAALRYVICCTCLGLMPICLFLTYASILSQPHKLVMQATALSMPSNAPTSGTSVLQQATASFENNLSPGSPLMPTIVFIWWLGVAILAVRKAGGFYLIWKLENRDVLCPSEAWQFTFQELCHKLGIDPRHICFKLSFRASVPMTFGWIRPVVLFPAALLTSLSPEEIELLLAHELAHIRRYDYVANIVQTAIETLFFYHPAIHWVSIQIRRERENACDDLLLVDKPMQALAYAKALLHLETARPAGSWLITAATGYNLLPRVQRILGQHNTSHSRSASGILTILFLVGLVAGLTAQTAPSQFTPSGEVWPNANATSIKAKLQSIIIDHVVFKNASINDVITVLNQKSKEADPEHVGINFVVQQGLPETGKVTMDMNDIPLKNLLTLSCALAKVSFSIVSDSIVIGPYVDENALVVRTFIVPESFFTQPAKSEGGTSVKFDVKQALMDKGILFPAKAAAVYLQGSGKLVVRDTTEQLDLIEELLKSLSPSTNATKVKIKVQIVSVDEGAYQQLKAEMDAAVQVGDLIALQKRTVNSLMLTAPVVTCKLGEKCLISIGPNLSLKQNADGQSGIAIQVVPTKTADDQISLELSVKLERQNGSANDYTVQTNSLRSMLTMKNGAGVGLWSAPFQEGMQDGKPAQKSRLAFLFSAELMQ